MKNESPYEQAYLRERKARLKAEKLLEDKSRELYLQNCKLEGSYEQLKKQQAIMLTQDKLATLGTLSAGIAHEVNNPLAFVKSNFESLQQYHHAYEELLKLILSVKAKLPEESLSELNELLNSHDFEFIQQDLPELMSDTAEGLTRVKDIILNLRNFSRTQSSDRHSADLLQGLQSTIKLLQGEFKNTVVLELDLNPLEKIECNQNELNQVFLNLLLNAKQAAENSHNPTINIRSWQDEENVYISISDNGCGMDSQTINQIFVPFFTTKEIGKGTGMGLAISYSIIQDHHGDITVESDLGAGSLFTVKLPKSTTA